MANKDLKLSPQNIDPFWWWYEEPSGIHIIHEMRDKNGRFIETQQRCIPWDSVRAALRRKDKKE